MVGEKHMSQAKAKLNSEEIKPVTLVELCLAGGISYLVSQLVEHSVN